MIKMKPSSCQRGSPYLVLVQSVFLPTPLSPLSSNTGCFHLMRQRATHLNVCIQSHSIFPTSTYITINNEQTNSANTNRKKLNSKTIYRPDNEMSHGPCTQTYTHTNTHTLFTYTKSRKCGTNEYYERKIYHTERKSKSIIKTVITGLLLPAIQVK